MLVSEVMTRNAISVQPRTTVVDAARIMLANHVSGLPVLNETGVLVGMVTEGDLLRRAEIGTQGEAAGWLKVLLQPAAVAAGYVVTHSRHVSGVMTHSPVFVTPDTSLEEVAQTLMRKRIKRLPVMEDNRLVGVISRADLLKALVSKLIQVDTDTTDDHILAVIKAEIGKANWAPKSGLNVSVKDKVVTLGGTIFSDEERQAVITIAENAPGVKDVKDQMVFVDPGSGLAFPPTL
ncbi:CBS domain-containing protein [Acidocella sp.]|uniref:CBS domain-containing protein n=1 Tax=Acidocella sp. TaxID=50710 RepID=UPI002608136A|nr:CBS domain-containing protein [Acidocella sp.]